MKYLKCLNITKKFGNNLVLDNFNYEFSSSYINFITGTNGSGKSTLISSVLEFLKFDGTIISNIKKILYQPEKVILPDYIKVKDYLDLIGKIHKTNSNDKMMELINLFGLEKSLKKDIIKLSKGMRQKVLLIQTLMIDGDAYIFDEPLSGLDPISQQKFIKEIEKLLEKDKLIIIVTHFIDQYNLDNKQIVNLNKKEDYKNV